MSMLTRPDQIAAYQLSVQIAALKLEMKGMKRKGRSAHSILKERFNIKGNKKKVLAFAENKRDEMANEVIKENNRLNDLNQS